MTRAIAGLAALVFTAACTHAGSAPGRAEDQAASRPPAASTSDAETIAAFTQRVNDYVALHTKLEKTLPDLPKETSPAVIDKHQRAMEALLREHRKGASRGDLFTPDAERLIRRILGQVFRGAEGARVKATIMDENPTQAKLVVNARYPDEVPLSTMPPQVLAMLPKLPDHLEYRFIGARLILLDVHAHTIVDYIENALP